MICGLLAPSVPEKQRADKEHEQRKELSSGKWTGQGRVWLSKQFAGDAHDRVKNKEAPGRHAIRFLELQSDQDEKREQQDPF